MNRLYIPDMDIILWAKALSFSAFRGHPYLWAPGSSSSIFKAYSIPPICPCFHQVSGHNQGRTVFLSYHGFQHIMQPPGFRHGEARPWVCSHC